MVADGPHKAVGGVTAGREAAEGTLGKLLSMVGLFAVGAARLAVAAEDAAGAEGGGLPQLDVGTFPSQIFWLILSFAVLYYLLTRKGLPRVSEILEARQDRIAADLDRAARLREEAEETLRRYNAMIEEAQERARTLLHTAQERIASEFAERQAGLERDLQARIREAEERIAAARAKALAEIGEVAVELVQVTAERLASLKITKKDARAAVARVAGE